MRYRYVGAPIALMVALNMLVAAAGPAYSPAALPADTVLKVRLNNSIRSDSNRPGDRFTATVEDPSLPSGTLACGVVTDVTPADNQTPGRLAVDFRSLELPSGRKIAMEGSPIGLDTRSVRTTGEGRLMAKSRSKGDVDKYIGYGAGGGVLIGSLLGKNVVGGLLGAGAGYLFGKGHEEKRETRNVVLKDGMELGIRLDQPVLLASQ